MAGYALSMLLLAVASLILIPSLIRSAGAIGWASIALGQAVGGIAAVVVAYGWQISGPARIAVADPAGRRVEYIESIILRSLLYLPVAAVAAVISMLVTPGDIVLAAAGALAASAIGLRANWYFVGVRRPYVLLLTETTPRVLGTAVAVVVLEIGAPALAGVLLQFAGSIAACIVSAAWILGGHRQTERRPRRPMREVLSEQRHGLTSTLTSAVYVAAPTMIVSAVAPGVLPVYVLADKVQRQITIALNPAVTVAQGWVPANDPAIRRRNSLRALTAGAGLAVVCSVAVLVAGPAVIDILGAGAVTAGFTVIALMAVFVGLNLYESIIARAVLAALDELRAVARATVVSSILGLAGVAIGAAIAGVIGALAGVTAGLLLRTGIELVVVARSLRRISSDQPETDYAGQPDADPAGSPVTRGSHA